MAPHVAIHYYSVFSYLSNFYRPIPPCLPPPTDHRRSPSVVQWNVRLAQNIEIPLRAVLVCEVYELPRKWGDASCGKAMGGDGDEAREEKFLTGNSLCRRRHATMDCESIFQLSQRFESLCYYQRRLRDWRLLTTFELCFS